MWAGSMGDSSVTPMGVGLAPSFVLGTLREDCGLCTQGLGQAGAGAGAAQGARVV